MAVSVGAALLLLLLLLLLNARYCKWQLFSCGLGFGLHVLLYTVQLLLLLLLLSLLLCSK
jgi:hypothetical protein